MLLIFFALFLVLVYYFSYVLLLYVIAIPSIAIAIFVAYSCSCDSSNCTFAFAIIFNMRSQNYWCHNSWTQCKKAIKNYRGKKFRATTILDTQKLFLPTVVIKNKDSLALSTTFFTLNSWLPGVIFLSI